MGHTKDIQCSTISSWLKTLKTLLHQGRQCRHGPYRGKGPYDVRAIAASKAFYGRVSMDQIMQACHWKSHNTFTIFYLRDLGQDQTNLGSYS